MIAINLKTQLYIFIELRSKKEAAMFKHITLRDKLILQYFIDFSRRMSLPELAKPKTVYSKSHWRNITAKASVFLNYILTDNASAFKRLHHEEQSLETEEQFFKRFFYNPYSSFQKEDVNVIISYFVTSAKKENVRQSITKGYIRSVFSY